MGDKVDYVNHFFKGLTMDDITHTYQYGNNVIHLTASQISSRFSQPFTKDIQIKTSAAIAKKRNIPRQQVLAEWEQEKNKACELGTATHNFAELYPYNKKLKPNTGFEKAVIEFWKTVPEHVVPFILELKMWHKEFMFAGTTDVILYNTITNKFILADYKTNKDLFKNYKSKKFKSPFLYLLDCPFNKGQVQLSLYQILFEQTGYEVSSRMLIWLKSDGSFNAYNTQDYTNDLKKYLSNDN